MRKLTKASLSELAESKEIISFLEQKSYVGGNKGDWCDPFSYGEFLYQLKSCQWQGGYVEGAEQQNGKISYRGGTLYTYISQDVNNYAGGTHFDQYFQNNDNPYLGGTEYQGGSDQFQTPEKKEKVKYDPNDCVWQTIAYIQYGDEGRGNDKLAREIAKEVLGDKFKEGDYACRMSYNDMQNMITNYFKTHDRAKKGEVKILVASDASDFYDETGERYDSKYGHAAVISSYNSNTKVITLDETQNDKTVYVNLNDLADSKSKVITIK